MNRNRGTNLIIITLFLTSIFAVFRATDVITCHWAYILLPMWLPTGLLLVFYYTNEWLDDYNRRSRAEEGNDDDDEYSRRARTYDRRVIISGPNLEEFVKAIDEFSLENTDKYLSYQYFFNDNQYKCVIGWDEKITSEN